MRQKRFCRVQRLPARARTRWRASQYPARRTPCTYVPERSSRAPTWPSKTHQRHATIEPARLNSLRQRTGQTRRCVPSNERTRGSEGHRSTAERTVRVMHHHGLAGRVESSDRPRLTVVNGCDVAAGGKDWKQR